MGTEYLFWVPVIPMTAAQEQALRNWAVFSLVFDWCNFVWLEFDQFVPRYERIPVVDWQTTVTLVNTIPLQYVNMTKVFVNWVKAIMWVHYNISGADIIWTNTWYGLESDDDFEVYYFI